MPRPAHSKAPSYSWIRRLATPYLPGYRAAAEARGALRGYRFFAHGAPRTRTQSGFFVGYLIDPANHEFLRPQTPECIVFAFIEPVGSASYCRLVTAEGSLLHRTAKYIVCLTHRPPRFAWSENQAVVLARHFSMRAWPAEKHQHYSRNFFIETLAWLVRSGLVRKLASEASLSGGRARSIERKK
ncbi:MAG: hypothetical protein LAN18_10410 [Acidobacteriia bacterium]|nr:hypothetical protein [Terriglobia bacterium]